MIPNIVTNVAQKLIHSAVTETAETSERKVNPTPHGPVRLRTVGNGQVRRAQKRAADRERRKAYKARVRQYHVQQAQAGRVRGHLQAVGVLPYFDGRAAPLHNQIRSLGWLIQRFGDEIVVDGEPTGRVSSEPEAALQALRNALGFYGEIVGLPGLHLPEGFALPEVERVAR